MKRTDEDFCRNAFDLQLRACNPALITSWQEVPRHEEPPDYWLTAKGTRYAVEVTSLFRMFPIGRSLVSARGLMVASMRTTKDIEKRARSLGVLHGAYVVTAKPVSDFAGRLDTLVADALRFIENAADTPTAEKARLAGSDYHAWSIQKVHTNKDIVYFAFSPGAMWEGQVVDLLKDQLAAILVKKAEKLGNVSAPCVLLVLDRLLYGGLGQWRQASQTLSVPTCFHSVVRVCWQDGATVLWSRGQIGAPNC